MREERERGVKEINKIIEVKLFFKGIESYRDSLDVKIHYSILRN